MTAPFWIICLLVLLTAQTATQSTTFRILDAGPRGEVAQLSEANTIRIVFSEPMVALGRVPPNVAPPWIHIEPAIRGTWRWSGTTVLMFTPDPATPLPYATGYTVTIDAGAASDAGHALGQPYSFSFMTPTVRLTSLRWFRQQDRFDQPTGLVLDFNQPVRIADVLAHAQAHYTPHDFSAPWATRRSRSRTLRSAWP